MMTLTLVTPPQILTGTLSLAVFCLAAAGATSAILARRRRRRLAEDLHELRGSITAARLAIDMMPSLGLCEPIVSMAASDELERSFRTLGDFERCFHRPLVARPAIPKLVGLTSRGTIDVAAEFNRLALIWGEASRRLGRDFSAVWGAPDVIVRGNRRHLTEALTNLLSNAVRHGAGKITLGARVRDGLLRIEVSDQGPGLNRPLAKMVQRRGRRIGPHGHGLSMVVRAAQRLGGAVSSAPSVAGTTIALVLPAEPEGPKAAGEWFEMDTELGVVPEHR